MTAVENTRGIFLVVIVPDPPARTPPISTEYRSGEAKYFHPANILN